jgi:hypothetical protein
MLEARERAGHSDSCARMSGVGHYVVPQSRKILTERVSHESRTFGT